MVVMAFGALGGVPVSLFRWEEIRTAIKEAWRFFLSKRATVAGEEFTESEWKACQKAGFVYVAQAHVSVLRQARQVHGPGHTSDESSEDMKAFFGELFSVAAPQSSPGAPARTETSGDRVSLASNASTGAMPTSAVPECVATKHINTLMKDI